MKEIGEVYEQAMKEFREERRREEIEKLKIQIKTKKTFWEKIFPFKIVITRR